MNNPLSVNRSETARGSEHNQKGRMKKLSIAVIGLALAGLCLAAAQAQDARETTYRVSANTNLTFTQTTSVNTNLYLLDGEYGGDRIVVCTSASGGLLFLDNTAGSNPQGALGGVVTNTYLNLSLTNASTNTVLLTKYQSNKFGGLPILGAAEITNAKEGNIIRLNPYSGFGRWLGRIFFVSTNTQSSQTNFTLNLNVIKLGK